MTSFTPKNWQDIKNTYLEIVPKLEPLITQLDEESKGILSFINGLSDGAGIIDECIKRYPKFVPHVKLLREYLGKLDACYKCMNDNEWLSSQPEWEEDYDKPDDSSDSSGSGSGGLSIMSLYKGFEINLSVVTNSILVVKQITNLTYQLQHGQSKFYNKTAIQDITRKMAINQRKVKSQEFKEEKDRIQDFMHQKQQSHER